MTIPRSLFHTDAPRDRDLSVVSGAWPDGVSGELLVSAPHPDTLGGPHPFFGEGVMHRLSLEPGRHGAPPDRFAWRTRRIDSPSARLRAKAPELFHATMVGVHSPFGHTNAANTAPLPWGDRLFATWDAGRPVELDPRTLGFLGEVGARRSWRVFEVSPQPVLPMVLSTAHPVIDPDRDVMWTVNVHWGELHVVRYRGDGDIESWPVEGAVIPQSVHTITQTRDWLVVGDCAYKVEPQVLSGGDRTEPANPDGPLHLIRKDDLDRTPPGEPVPVRTIRIAPEINHYYADLDDRDGVAIVFEHTETADIAMTQQPGDLDALGRPCDPALAGLYGFPMSPDRISRVVIDPERERVLDRVELRDPSLLWGRQLNALDWSTEGRTRPTLHHTVHHGWRPEAITQKMLALYGDRVDRTLWPPEPTPPLLVSTSVEDLRVASHHEFAMDDFPSSPIFVPREPGGPDRSRHAGTDPGGHDGWVVVPVMNDAGFRVELFDAAAVGNGPLATLAAPGMTLPFALHAAWTPVQGPAPDVERVRFADELDRIDELPPELADLVRSVAAELDEGVPLEEPTA
jgi:carotenoid cleavage dioxygenase-like enzyme